MTKLSELTKEVISEIVPASDEREAILQGIQIQDTFGSGKSIDLLDKYEKIIEGLIK